LYESKSYKILLRRRWSESIKIYLHCSTLTEIYCTFHWLIQVFVAFQTYISSVVCAHYIIYNYTLYISLYYIRLAFSFPGFSNSRNTGIKIYFSRNSWNILGNKITFVYTFFINKVYTLKLMTYSTVYKKIIYSFTA
jgi:hypothetical protein